MVILSNRKNLNLIVFTLFVITTQIHAKDLGVQGSLYEIKEQDALLAIEARLNQLEKNGEIERQQVFLKERTLNSIENPRQVLGLKSTVQARIFEKDLTIVLAHDIQDATGQVIHKAGSKFNPLSQFYTRKSMIFFDGNDDRQLKWALKEYEKNLGLAKLVLVNGAPLKLMRAYEIPFYFDQHGKLVDYFKIEQVPAVVSQKADKLIIAEIKL